MWNCETGLLRFIIPDITGETIENFLTRSAKRWLRGQQSSCRCLDNGLLISVQVIFMMT